MQVISVFILPFSESSLSYIRVLIVVELGYPIVMLRVCDILVSECAIHFFLSC